MLTLLNPPAPSNAEAAAYAAKLLRRDSVIPCACCAKAAVAPHVDPELSAFVLTVEIAGVRVDVWNEPDANGGHYVYGEY